MEPFKSSVPNDHFEFTSDVADDLISGFELLIDDVKRRGNQPDDNTLDGESFSGSDMYEQYLEEAKREEREIFVEDLRRKDTPRSRSLLQMWESIDKGFAEMQKNYSPARFLRYQEEYIASLQRDCSIDVPVGNFRLILPELASLARKSGDFMLADRLEYFAENFNPDSSSEFDEF